MFLYGLAIGAACIFFPTLFFVCMLHCYKKKKGKGRSLSQQNEAILTETQDTIEEDFSPPKRPAEEAETQNVGQSQELSEVKGKRIYENVVRKANDSPENSKAGASESRAPEATESGNEFSDGCNLQGVKPSVKTAKGRKGYLQIKREKTGEGHPLYENCEGSRRYMHLAPENKIQRDTPDAKSAKAKEKEDAKGLRSVSLPIKTQRELPKNTGTEPRCQPSSPAYVNAHMAKLLVSAKNTPNEKT